ncbi:hypothetical protein M0R45_032363 [Rubus argutus]|uniref:Uncharacterized protein n=1 Tax=Rubus argutus TaxID=59490 RepID=A0AAW1WKY5_RUBAR
MTTHSTLFHFHTSPSNPLSTSTATPHRHLSCSFKPKPPKSSSTSSFSFTPSPTPRETESSTSGNTRAKCWAASLPRTSDGSPRISAPATSRTGPSSPTRSSTTPFYRDRIEWESAENALSGNRSNAGGVSELLGISERFGWDNDDKVGWSRVNFELLGTSKGGRIPRRRTGKQRVLEESEAG